VPNYSRPLFYPLASTRNSVFIHPPPVAHLYLVLYVSHVAITVLRARVRVNPSTLSASNGAYQSSSHQQVAMCLEATLDLA